MTRSTARTLRLVFLFVWLPGCLTNQYTIPQNELVRVSHLPIETRTKAVHVIENVGPPPSGSRVGVDARTNVHYSSSSGGSASGKGGKSGAIAVIAAVVAVGAAIGLALAMSEGMRYDGWAQLDPNQTVRLNNGTTLRMTELTPELARTSHGGTVNGGPDFIRLGRAPLNRSGLTWTTAFHATGIPTIGGTSFGVGGATHFGVNIRNMLTIGFAAYIDSSVYGQRGVLASCGPEIQLFPTKYVGVYGGVGWLFRDSVIKSTYFTDSGEIYRAGLLAEVPLTTRLALQFRAGAFMASLNDTNFSGEALFGLAIY